MEHEIIDLSKCIDTNDNIHQSLIIDLVSEQGEDDSTPHDDNNNANDTVPHEYTHNNTKITDTIPSIVNLVNTIESEKTNTINDETIPTEINSSPTKKTPKIKTTSVFTLMKKSKAYKLNQCAAIDIRQKAKIIIKKEKVIEKWKETERIRKRRDRFVTKAITNHNNGSKAIQHIIDIMTKEKKIHRNII